MSIPFGTRRAIWTTIDPQKARAESGLTNDERTALEEFDEIYRTLCALLYNYVPLSGHPGGSISSGRFVASVLFNSAEYDLGDPDRDDADIVSYAAGHKALGLYAMWALRNEVARAAARDLLAPDSARQLRLEDLLGFRRNPSSRTPLFTKFSSKALDGHPTPATPFVRLSTGASGVGLASSLGLALGAADAYSPDPPRVHVVEGEGGLTPGRVAEALAFAGTASLSNAIVHLDWNQASIDSDHVCRDGDKPGDYVQWTPAELFYLHDWNVVLVEDGFDVDQVAAAQKTALTIDNGQPTAIIYRTVKGWKYGIEGRASHGAGHKFCSPDFYATVEPLFNRLGRNAPTCDQANPPCRGGTDAEVVERCFWEALSIVRAAIEERPHMTGVLAGKLRASRERLFARKRALRSDGPLVERVYSSPADLANAVPESVSLKPGSQTTLRGQLGKVLGYFNKMSEGAVFVAAADLLGSTSVNEAVKSFPGGYFNTRTNPKSRTLSVGGICEDAISGVLSGLSSFGHHIGVGSSYAAFIAPLGHIASRLHAIGNMAQQGVSGTPYRPMILVCGHAGLKTGEDGPTHADPQALQLLQENFPDRTMITLTPWDPQEIWPLMQTSLSRRPAIIAPFVTRPSEIVVDRHLLHLAPASDATKGVYLLRKAKRGDGDGTVILQESAIAYEFVLGALPLLDREEIDLNVYYVASAELFDSLTTEEQEDILPERRRREAIGVTGFTLPTMYRWVTSELGRAATLHPFRHGHFLGSGQGQVVVSEAGLDGKSQYEAILRYLTSKSWAKNHVGV